MITRDQFAHNVLQIAQQQGFKVELSKRLGQLQIDFGNMKLHATHLAQLFEAAMDRSQNIPYAIERIAPGRPCTHKPMRDHPTATGRIELIEGFIAVDAKGQRASQ